MMHGQKNIKKASNSLCLSVCPSAFPHETTRLPPNRFSLNLIF